MEPNLNESKVSQQPLLTSELDNSRITVKINDEEMELDTSQLNTVKSMLKNEPLHSSALPGGSSSTLAKPGETKHFDHNHFATKKTVGLALLLVTLISTNATQLKAVVQTSSENPFAGILIFFIIISLLLCIGVGGVLLMVGKANLNTDSTVKRKRIDFLNNIGVALIMLITIVNVIISSFGLMNNPTYLIQMKAIKKAMANPNVTFTKFTGKR